MNEPLRLLESAHTMSIILYVHENPGCRKIDVYSAVSRNQSLPSRFIALEEAGLIVLDKGPACTRITLTDKGNRVAELLGRLRSEL